MQTEEGLAIYHQNMLKLPMGEKTITPALLTVGIFMGAHLGFHDLFWYLKDTFSVSDEISWKICLKAKRGLIDTKKPLAFTKDSIYFRGAIEVENFKKRGKRWEDIYLGKIKISDIPYLQDKDFLVPPKLIFKGL